MNDKSKQMHVPYFVPDCGQAEIDAVTEVIKGGWLTTASRTLQFEKDFAAFTGVRHCLAVNSCTAAMHLALEAIGIGPKDKVILPVHTFTATAEVVRYLGADPVFTDIDKKTLCLTPDAVRKAISQQDTADTDRRLKAIMPVHFGGHPCDMSELKALAIEADLCIVEDAAHAFPTKADMRTGNKIKPQMIGTIGDATCFSFYANKTITTAEGGMVATDNDAIASRVKTMRLHGINRDVWDRFSDIKADWRYDVVAPGYKYNMPDLAAAIGVEQLKKAERLRLARQRIADIYLDELQNIAGLDLPQITCPKSYHSWHLFIVYISQRRSTSGLNRDTFMQRLQEKGIGTSVHYIPLHRMTYYRDRYKLTPDMFPNSEWVYQRCISLPIFSSMQDEQIKYVINTIRNIM